MSLEAGEGLKGQGGNRTWQARRSIRRDVRSSGDSVAISAYLGSGDAFEGAISDFAEAYADQNATDHGAHVAAVATGRVSTMVAARRPSAFG